MDFCNLLLDTCVAVKRLQEDDEGCQVRDFLIDKKQYLSKYSITEFKKTFVESVIFLDSMIKEGRSLSEIYQDINDMKINSDTELSKLGRRLEILLGIMGNPKKINDQILWRLKMWYQHGMLTFLFIDNLTLMESLTNCPMGDSYKGDFSDIICEEDVCKIQKVLTNHEDKINKIKEACEEISNSSFKDMCETLNEDLIDFDRLKCRNLGDIIIAFDYLGFFENDSDCALCSTDHHYDTLCPILEINKINPLTKDILIYPT